MTILVCWGVYAVTVVAVSLGSETRPLALGTDKCFDDWCATVIAARSLPNPSGGDSKLVAVTLRISNRARQAAFRPSQPRLSLQLGSGESISPSQLAQHEFEQQAGTQEDIARRLLAGESFQTSLVFEVPTATRAASVVILEGPNAITRILLGDENSFLHRKMVYPITVN